MRKGKKVSFCQNKLRKMAVKIGLVKRKDKKLQEESCFIAVRKIRKSKCIYRNGICVWLEGLPAMRGSAKGMRLMKA